MMDRREQYAGNENRAKHSANINTPTDCSSVSRPASPNDMPSPLRGDAPMTLGPHDGGRLRNDNASAPTHAALHTGPVTPGYTGVSPRVAAELYKAPSAFASRIRDHAKNK
jgi:hypothetical protein